MPFAGTNWKVHFAIVKGNIATGERIIPNWPVIHNLRADPYEMMHEHGTMGYLRWYGDNMWLFVPVQAEAQRILRDDSRLSIPGRIQPLGWRNQLQLAEGHEGDGTC